MNARLRPPSVKDQWTLTLPRRWETNRAVMADIVEMVRFGLPDDYWATYADTVRTLTLDDVSAEAIASSPRAPGAS